MMKVRNFLIAIVSIAGGFSSYAQSNLLNAKTPAQIGLKTPAQLISDNDKPLAYGYVDDRDILMGKTTWEIIDLNEKINFPLYFPILYQITFFNFFEIFDIKSRGERFWAPNSFSS